MATQKRSLWCYCCSAGPPRASLYTLADAEEDEDLPLADAGPLPMVWVRPCVPREESDEIERIVLSDLGYERQLIVPPPAFTSGELHRAIRKLLAPDWKHITIWLGEDPPSKKERAALKAVPVNEKFPAWVFEARQTLWVDGYREPMSAAVDL